MNARFWPWPWTARLWTPFTIERRSHLQRSRSRSILKPSKWCRSMVCERVTVASTVSLFFSDLRITQYCRSHWKPLKSKRHVHWHSLWSLRLIYVSSFWLIVWERFLWTFLPPRQQQISTRRSSARTTNCYVPFIRSIYLYRCTVVIYVLSKHSKGLIHVRREYHLPPRLPTTRTVWHDTHDGKSR